MDIKVIKTEHQYHQYIDELEKLMCLAPTKNSLESERLELIALVLEVYENETCPPEAPDPIEAIKFRMEELSLKQIDLVNIDGFGTRSRVSEVLSRKRPLTIQMIKSLSTYLSISTDTLLGVNSLENSQKNKTEINWSKFPIKEILKKGWFSDLSKPTKSLENKMKDFIEKAGLNIEEVAFRRTLKGDGVSPGTKYALYAWLAKVTLEARSKKPNIEKFDDKNITPDFLKKIAQLSWFEDGPLLAIQLLEKNGIIVVIEPALKSTLIDGAAFKDNDGTPIIGLTLRFDRLDNFWFTLMHELAHVWKHLSHDDAFFDDSKVSSKSRIEAEANRIAREAFIPRSLWKRSQAYTNPSEESIEKLARDLKIHPAIIAGQLRKENNYYLFSNLIGQNEVKKLFEKTR